MSKNSYDFDWQKLPSDKSAYFRPITDVAGRTCLFATSNLPIGHQKMEGLQSAVVSGYAETYKHTDNITGIGELVLIRYESTTAKAYAYPVGMGTDGLHLAGEFKSFPGHHFPTSASVPVDDIFGQIHWPCSTCSGR
jgi:hypothetical protein